jgi:hypothetical protein
VLFGPRSGLAAVMAPPCRVGAEQGLAVVAAEQEGEPVQVLAQLRGAVGGVADELRNCSISASSAASAASSLTSGTRITVLSG